MIFNKLENIQLKVPIFTNFHKTIILVSKIKFQNKYTKSCFGILCNHRINMKNILFLLICYKDFWITSKMDVNRILQFIEITSVSLEYVELAILISF